MGYNKYTLFKKQVSYDSGTTWQDVMPLETTPSGDCLGSYFTIGQCTQNQGLKFLGNYYNGIIYTLPNDGNPTLTSSEVKVAEYPYTNMTSAVVGEGVTSIGSGAFDVCDKLTSITIANSVIDIGELVFHRCTGLTSIDIPDNTMSIGFCAFSGATNIRTMTVGNGIQSIGDKAFYNCRHLSTFIIHATNPPYIGTSIGSVFDFTAIFLGYGYIYVPDESLYRYKEDSKWSGLASRILPLSSAPT